MAFEVIPVPLRRRESSSEKSAFANLERPYASPELNLPSPLRLSKSIPIEGACL